MIFYIIFISFCIATYIYYFTKRNHSRGVLAGLKEIPLESGLPIIGVLNKIGDSFSKYLWKLNLKHGPIFRIKFGMRDIVVLNNFEYVKGALVGNGDVLSGRWKLLNYITAANNAGLGLIDGQVWAEQRAFVLKTLKEFGMGKSRSSEIVQDECLILLEDLENMEGKCVDMSTFLPIYIGNVICKFLMNKRFSHGDPDFIIIEKIGKEVVNDKDGISILSLMFPILDRFEWIIKFLVWITARKFVFNDFHNMMTNVIKEQSIKLDLNSEGKDLVDKFLITQNQMRDKYGSVGTFSDWQLVRNTLELLIGGYDTTTTALVWGFMYMAMLPEIQNKVYKEIIDKIGNERLPRMTDKVSLNYTQAVLDEILRLSSTVPIPPHRRTLENISVNGYFIPKNSLVSVNIFGCHRDPNIWEKPYDFYPEHFLSTEKGTDLKYKPREELIAFGMGKRQCLGESLARTELFVFFTSVLQRFEVSLAKKITGKYDFDSYIGHEGFIRSTRITDFTFKRKH